MAETHGSQIAMGEVRFTKVRIAEIGTALRLWKEQLAVFERARARLRTAKVSADQATVFESCAFQFGLLKFVVVQVAVDEGSIVSHSIITQWYVPH